MRKEYISPVCVLRRYEQEDIIRTSLGEEETIPPTDPNELPPVFIN